MWFKSLGKDSDIVLSSRVRLARNIKNFPFENKMTEEDRLKVIEKVKNALSDFKYIDLKNISETEKKSYVEKHLISPYMVSSKNQRGLLINDKSNISVMLIEEDHIRIQAMTSGFDLDLCFKNADEVDNRIEEKEEFAFSEKFGYLTSCPTNIGTGMRASVMMHLPGLSLSGKMEGIIASLSKLSVAVRGIYGEGSKALGNIYQISNQVTLGVSEEEILGKMKQIVSEIIEKERNIQKGLYEKNKFKLMDKVMRSFSILIGAVILSSDEMMSLISDVRMGINLGIIKDITNEKINDAIYSALPFSITAKYNLLTLEDRDLKRAELMKEIFS